MHKMSEVNLRQILCNLLETKRGKVKMQLQFRPLLDKQVVLGYAHFL